MQYLRAETSIQSGVGRVKEKPSNDFQNTQLQKNYLPVFKVPENNRQVGFRLLTAKA